MIKEKNKKTIHFILPGGGVRGCFQAGFIYQLRKNYSDYFEIYQVDGTSVGALNGMALLFQDYEKIKELWFSIKSIDDVFDPWTNRLLWYKIKTAYNGFYQKSFCQNNGLRNLVSQNIQYIQQDLLDKYHCVVSNIYTGDFEYINGKDPNLHEFIIASSSPWIISPPVEINNHLYIDGGLLQTYPTKNIPKSNADIKLLIGYDTTHLNKIGMAGANMITYLARLIDIGRLNHNNIENLHRLINEHNIHSIENPLDYPFLDFSQERIIQGFDLGIEAANKFAAEVFTNNLMIQADPEKNHSNPSINMEIS